MNAFQFDKSVRLLYTQDEAWKIVLVMIQNCIDSNHFILRLAVDRATEAVAGWMAIGIIPEDDSRVDPAAYVDWPIATTQLLLAGKAEKARERVEAEEPRRLLVNELEAQSLEGQATFLRGKRMVVNTLVTDPEYRKRGVASELLKWAAEYANTHAWPVWAQIPSKCLAFFASRGFVDVGGFELNLDHHAEKVDEEAGRPRRSWGVQAWKHVVLGDGKDGEGVGK